MSKFRKRPVVIEAVQYHTGDRVEGVCKKPCHSITASSGRPHIHTLEGNMSVSDGDWIITGIKGEIYPCKPDIFEATYDAAKDDLLVMSQEAIDKIGEWQVSLHQMIEEEDYQEFFQDGKDGSTLMDQLTGLFDEMVGALKGHTPQGCCTDPPAPDTANPQTS